MSQTQKRKQPSQPQQQQQQPRKTSHKISGPVVVTPSPKSLPDIKRGWDWYESIGSPRFVLSPMVGQSELAYRQLLRSHGATLTYTPMIIADEYIKDASYRSSVFSWDEADRPLVVQLCATESNDFLAAAKLIISQCNPDAIELNLGCPQSCAERGGYGSWMMENVNMIKEILSSAVASLPVAITAKIRVFPTLSQTYQYIDMLAATGISLLTVHPRQRHHREEVLSQWDLIESIRNRVNIPVVLNGDIWGPMDLAMAMCLHNVDGYMCAQGALQMPTIFKTLSQFTEYNRPVKQQQHLPSDETQVISPVAKKQNTNNNRSSPTPTPAKGSETNQQSSPAHGQNSQSLVQLGKAPVIDLPENITFISTKAGPYANGAKTVGHFRLRKDLGTALSKQPLSLPSSIQTLLLDTALDVNQRIIAIYDLIPQDDKSKYRDVIEAYPLTTIQRANFQSNPLHFNFVSVILHLESHIDHCKRQLQNAVEYIRIIEKYPVFHHSVAQRHLFFILFDLLNKHIDCYDLLYVATDIDGFKEVVRVLHRKAAANADFTGCKPDNYFTKNKKDRNRRRDGTLAPPPWPVGGGGFNVALNGKKAKEDKANRLKGELLPCIPQGKSTVQVGGKKIDMSKFD